MSRSTAEKALDFIAQAAPAGKDFNLVFHGGEPLPAGEDFYRWIFPEITDRFGQRAHISLHSNLWALTDELADLFRKYHVSVGTGLDGPEDMCDEQRGPGYYQNTTKGIGILLRHGIPIEPICTFSADNAGRAAEVYRKSRLPYSIRGVGPMLGAPADPLCTTPEDMAKILEGSYQAYRSDPAHNRIRTIDILAKTCFQKRSESCIFSNCLGSFAAIDPNGDIYSCQRFCGMKEYCLGNVCREHNDLGITESPAYRNLQQIQAHKAAACQDCDHSEYCSGGCLYNTIAAHSDRDPYCSAYRTIFDRIIIDMSQEMCQVLLGEHAETPTLAMAGEQRHPYEIRKGRELVSLALKKGAGREPFAEEHLRDPFPESRMNKLYLHITFNCPLRCSHCYAEGGERKTKEMTPQQLAAIVREAADRMFCSLVITGGEPLVYSGFDEFCSLLRGIDRKGMKLVLRTSLGFPLSEERIRMISTLFDEIAVSVDGNKETHDARRGPGQYDRTVKNLETAASASFTGKYSLAAVLGEADITGDAGSSVRELADRLNIGKVRFRPVLPLGRAGNAVRERISICSEETEYPESIRLHHSCGLGSNLYVLPNGEVFPCYAWCEAEHKLGDLSCETLSRILDRGDIFEYCRHDVDTNEKCRSCEVRYLCGGICKAWVNNKKDPDSGDFDCADRKECLLRMAERVLKGE